MSAPERFGPAAAAAALLAAWRILDGKKAGLLGGSSVVINGVISILIWALTIVTLLITPLLTTHEPPNMGDP